MPTVPSFAVASEDIAHGEMLGNKQLFNGMGATGDNISPQLEWSGFPAETKSFAVTCYDPDALPGPSFHVRNNFGTKDFGGAAPPPGDEPHRYVFAVHAVDVETLGIDSDVSPAVAGVNLRFHTIARAVIIPV